MDLLKMDFLTNFPPQKEDMTTAILTNDLIYLKSLLELHDYSDGDLPAVASGDEDPTMRHPLELAASFGHLDQVSLLAGALGNEHVDRCGALVSAAREGHADIVSYLVRETNADVNVTGPEGRTAMQIAAQRGHTDVLDIIRSTD